MSVRADIVTRWDQLLAQRDAWLELLARSSANEPTLSPLWLDTWWRIFGDEGGRALRAVLVYDGDRLIGMAPLLVRRAWYRGALPLRRIELLATGEPEADEIYSEYLNVISEQGQETRVARALVQTLRGGGLGRWDEMVLDMMDPLSPMTRALLHELRRARLLRAITPHKPCPYIPLPGSWDAYLGQLSSSRRYYIKRTVRALEKWAGDALVLKRATTPAELEEGTSILIDLHTRRWRSEGRAGVFASQRFTRFHRTVMSELLAAGGLDLMWLCKGDEPLAAVYNIIWDNKVYFYQAGRAPDAPKNVRLGIAIHAYAIQHAIACGRSKYDFLAGITRYKQQLALAQTPLACMHAANPLSLSVHTRRLARHGESLARSLRQRFGHRLPDGLTGRAPPAPADD